jgi:integrase/recombinase XerD
MRRTELASLLINDVDIENRLVTINLGKGAKDRIIPISERACLWIAFYLKYIRPKYAHLTSGQYLFLNDKGNAYRPSTLSDMASKYAKRSGASSKGACSLFRHASATIMLDNDAELRFIQKLLGHADISTTQIYTHVSTKKLSSVYTKTHPSARKSIPENVQKLLKGAR